MIRFFQNLKFRMKLFLIFLLISLIPTIALGTFCYNQLRTLLIEREQTALRDSIIQESMNISTQLSSYETIVDCIIWDRNLINVLNQTYSRNSQMFHAYEEEIEPFFATLSHIFPDINEIIIYTDLDIYSRTGVLEPISKIESFSWYPKVYDSIHPLWVRYPTDDDLAIVCRFMDVPSDISAFILIQIDTRNLFSSLATLFSHSYGVLLTDTDGTPIWRFHADDLPDNAISSAHLSTEYLSDLLKNDYVVESIVDQYTGWTYYIFRPIQTVIESTQTMIITMLTIIILCLICVLLFSFWLSHALGRPLEELTHSINQVISGNYKIMLTPHSSDEIGELMESFSIMVQHLNKLITETLEAKIIQQKLEFRALQAQINPHFLYNTLSLINSQSILAGHPEIGLPARYLATFYLTALNKGRDLILVSDELKNIKAYIKIQLIMHSDSFDVNYDIKEDILQFTMPNLMLQPLVENAIVHGIYSRKSNRRGSLYIMAKDFGDNLVFRIADNGCGIPEDKLATILTSRSAGYGVENVHTRAQLLYGSQFGLHYHSQVGSGTEVTLTIPKQK